MKLYLLSNARQVEFKCPSFNIGWEDLLTWLIRY